MANTKTNRKPTAANNRRDAKVTLTSRNGHGIASSAIQMTESTLRAMRRASNSMVVYGD